MDLITGQIAETIRKDFNGDTMKYYEVFDFEIEYSISLEMIETSETLVLGEPNITFNDIAINKVVSGRITLPAERSAENTPGNILSRIFMEKVKQNFQEAGINYPEKFDYRAKHSIELTVRDVPPAER